MFCCGDHPGCGSLALCLVDTLTALDVALVPKIPGTGLVTQPPSEVVLFFVGTDEGISEKHP